MNQNPAEKLLSLMLVTRGGSASNQELACDVQDWIEQNGMPTDDSLRRWVFENAPQFELGLIATQDTIEREQNRLKMLQAKQKAVRA